MKKLLWIIALLSISFHPIWAEPDDTSTEEYSDEVSENYSVEEIDEYYEEVLEVNDEVQADSTEREDWELVEPRDSVLRYEKIEEQIDYDLKNYGPGTALKKVEPKEKKSSNFNLIELLVDFINMINAKAFIVIIIVILLIIASICGTVYFRNISYRKKQEKMAKMNMAQEDLMDANENFDLMMKKQDYKEAIRIIYVRTLTLLNNKEIIHWERSKTPSEYYYEVKSRSIKAPFKNLTHTFLLARYDNIEVSREMVEEALTFEKGVIAAVK